MNRRASTSTRVVRSATLPPPSAFGPGAVLLYDRALSRLVPGFANFAHEFPKRVSVRAGEALKDVESFPGHIARLVEAFSGHPRGEAKLVCAGGGSVGDFGGFSASVIQRGIGLIYIPTTWLAAVDSAHGGKTALNVGGVKNQIGTFYEPTRVHLVADILNAQPDIRAREGMAELVKMAFIDGGPWATRLLSEDPTPGSRNAVLWGHLAPAIAAKKRVVAKDSNETRGFRQVLNLGHTLGHVLEAHHELPHGRAVALGIHFALDWSSRDAGLKRSTHLVCTEALVRLTGESPATHGLRPIPQRTFTRLLVADKKAAGGRGSATPGSQGGDVTFVFLRGLGSPLRRRVQVSQVTDAARRNGWVS